MVSMTDTVEYPKAYSCCMRQTPDATSILEDGININFVLTLVYIGSYAVGMHMSCLGSFLAILLNSMYMISLVYPGVDTSDNGNTEDEHDDEAEHDEQDDEADHDEQADEADHDEQADEAEQAEDDEADQVDSDLSLKQREHGAVKSKSLSEEDDAVLYEKLYEIVQETQRRNEARSRALTRTPTSSSLAGPDNSEDEYADMPPLVHANSVLRNRVNAKENSKVNNRIPSIREILEGYNTMDAVD